MGDQLSEDGKRDAGMAGAQEKKAAGQTPRKRTGKPVRTLSAPYSFLEKDAPSSQEDPCPASQSG